MRKLTSLIFVFVFSSFVLAQNIDVLTRAEKTDYKETSRYTNVIDFIKKLKESSKLIEYKYIGMSQEGRKIPLIIAGHPWLRTPESAKLNNKLIIYIQANIHAGEVEGKEATLMLIRDILNERREIFNEVVLLVTPIFNVDGNEKISKEHRQNQIGPEEGVGIRYNSQNLDLNRDGIKAEAVETQALYREIYNKWDPYIMVDCHTTNGSKHRYSLTFSAPTNPNNPAKLLNYLNNEFLQNVTENVKKKHGHNIFFYGNFSRRGKSEENSWFTFGHQARYASNYYGFRNRIGILSEAYAYVDFKTRIEATYSFLLEIINEAIEKKQYILNLIREIDKTETLSFEPIGLKFERTVLFENLKFLGYNIREHNKDKWRPMPDDEPTEKEVTYYGAFDITKSVEKPAYYIFSKNIKKLAKLLKLHNIKIGVLKEDIEIEVEAYYIIKLNRSDNLYQGHYLQNCEIEKEIITKKFQVGDFIIPMNQPFYKLAGYIIEPESDDGIVTWGLINNFINVKRERGWFRSTGEYPIYRILKKHNFIWESIN